MSQKYVLIFVKTPYEKTPYDIWLKFTGITPLLLVAEEFSVSYAHMANVYAFANYDSNPQVTTKAFELADAKNVVAIFARAEADIIRAAHLRKILQIQGQNLVSAIAYRDKVIMKNYLQNSDVKIPSYQAIDTLDDIVNFVAKNQLPVVIKPRSESGSLGTAIINNQKELETYIEQNPNLNNLEIESFVKGQMYHIDGFIRNNELVFIQPSKYINDCLSFRDDLYAGTVTLTEDDSHYLPLIETTKKVISHLPAAVNMVFHAELWVTESAEVIFCEIASRTGGGPISSVLERTFSINLDKEWLYAECGIEPTFAIKQKAIGGGVWIPPQRGVLKRLPTGEMPSWVSAPQYYAKIGAKYNGGVKSGLFLAGFVIHGTNQEEIIERIHLTADWFEQNSEWDHYASVDQ